MSLEELLEMTDDQVCETLEKFGANSEECARLNASLSCLRNVHKSGVELSWFCSIRCHHKMTCMP